MFLATCRGVDFHAPMPRHLDRHMRRRAEAVEGQPLPSVNSGNPQRTKSNNSRAQKGRSLLIGERFGNRVNEVLRRNRIFRKPTIMRVASERRIIAKVFLPRAAVFARAVRAMQPSSSDARADHKSLCSLS